MPDLAWIDGKMAPADEAMVSASDRAYCFGDAFANYRRKRFRVWLSAAIQGHMGWTEGRAPQRHALRPNFDPSPRLQGLNPPVGLPCPHPTHSQPRKERHEHESA